MLGADVASAPLLASQTAAGQAVANDHPELQRIAGLRGERVGLAAAHEAVIAGAVFTLALAWGSGGGWRAYVAIGRRCCSGREPIALPATVDHPAAYCSGRACECMTGTKAWLVTPLVAHVPHHVPRAGAELEALQADVRVLEAILAVMEEVAGQAGMRMPQAVSVPTLGKAGASRPAAAALH